jgi:hypothetical protein
LACRFDSWYCFAFAARLDRSSARSRRRSCFACLRARVRAALLRSTRVTRRSRSPACDANVMFETFTSIPPRRLAVAIAACSRRARAAGAT